MSDINHIVISGRLTRNPDLRHTPDGKAVCDLVIASNRDIPKKDGKGYHRHTVFIKATLWGDRASRWATKLTKSDEVFVSGELSDDNYVLTDEQGEYRTDGRLKIGHVDVIRLVKKALPQAAPGEDSDPS